MGKIAVAVIHGLGSEEQFYSVELKHRITEEYLKSNPGFDETDLVFHEIYWGNLISDDLHEFRQKSNYKGDLSYQNLRQIVTDVQAMALLYKPKTAFYESVNNRIKDEFRRFSSHRGIDQNNTPLIILAHSFGAVVMTNYINKIRHSNNTSNGSEQKERSDFELMRTLCGYVTFGNPMGLYAIKNNDLLMTNPDSIAGDKLSDDLQEMAKWYNFYDKDDIIAYPLKGLSELFDQHVTADIEINVGSAATSWNPACHTGYWEDKDFYKPVARFLTEISSVI
ncbi:MAG: hypothetical protein OEY19_11065 [Gammaproteobacteria bacterium]|nr:hypothetical protein [Gammaproteobacteria bacterium]MDH5629260.1 hypothetical protein [Gammaproteobacteria bacterium]